MKLYLDDEREAPAGWVRVKTADLAVALLEENNFEVVSLDHDLGYTSDKHKTGYDVLCWIEEQVYMKEYPLPEIRIHTANPAARRKMESAVEFLKENSKLLTTQK